MDENNNLDGIEGDIRWAPVGCLPRRYLVRLGGERRVVVSVEAEEDASLPVPMEREDWRAVEPTVMDAAAAFAVLHHAPVIAVHEVAFQAERGRA